MGNPKEITLQVKDFRGINRFADGSVTPPNEFETLDGFHPPSRGELATNGGVSSQGSAVTGVARWVRSALIRTAEGRDKTLAFFVPDVSSFSFPTITTSNFTGLSAGANTNTFVIQYVGPGGLVWTYEYLYDNTVELDDGGTFTFVLPSGIPDYIAQVDVYLGASGAYTTGFASLWCGSAHRGPSGLPSQVICFVPVDAVSSSAISTNTAIRPDTVFVDSDNTAALWTGQGLTPGKIYYLGIAGHMGVGDGPNDDLRGVRASVVDSNDPATTLSFVAPISGTSIIRMGFANRPAGAGANTIQVHGIDVQRFVPFIGCTPEDMHAVGDLSHQAQNRITSVAMTPVRYVFSATDATADTVDVDNELTEELRDGDKVLLNSSTAANLPAGLSNNTAYWLKIVNKNSFSTTVKFATSKANLLAGTFVNLTTAGSTLSVHKLYLQRCIFTVAQLPRNSRNSLEFTDNVLHKGCTPLVNPQDNSAIASRTDAFFRNSLIQVFGENSVSGTPDPITPDSYKFGVGVALPQDLAELVAYSGDTWSLSALPILGCWVCDGFPFSMTEAYQLLPDISQRSFSKRGNECLTVTTQTPAPNVFWRPKESNSLDEDVSTQFFGQRLYCANGENTLWYTNGFVWQPIRHNDGKAIPPTSRFVSAVNNTLVAAGGLESFQNSKGQVYRCEPDSPFDWGTNINSFNVPGPRDISGLGAFSQNLTDSSYSSYLVVSKEDSIWIWDATNGPRQLYQRFGFASSRSFFVNDFFPGFIARENVYMIAGDTVRDIGDEIAPILKSLTEDQLKRIECTWHDKKVKILYPGANGDTSKTKELWLEVRSENGGVVRFFSGPHTNTNIREHSSGLTFDGSRDVRVGLGTNGHIYLMDQPSVSRARQIVLSRLGLESEHLWKLFKEIDLAVEIAQNETFTLTLDGEDGSSQYVNTVTGTFSTASRQLLQHLLTSRFRGRINKLTITNTSSAAYSFFDISLRFEVLKRSLLR